MKRILVTGGSGFLGRRLVHALLGRGDLVTVLTRDVAAARRRLPRAVRVAAWSPEREGPWCEELHVVDAVVHLAGENLGRRWTAERKVQIERSRVASTETLVRAIGAARRRPSVLVSASAVGYYGPLPPDAAVDEGASPGRDFLAGVVQRWEEAAREAEQHGVRVVTLRFGVVFGDGGGALQQMVMPFRFFVGGPLGRGDQVVSWIHRDDAVGLVLLALDREEARGAINAVAPGAVTSRELARAIGMVLNRPAWLPVPPAALRLHLGEGAGVALTGQRVVPARATELGYTFRYDEIVPALESIIAPQY